MKRSKKITIFIIIFFLIIGLIIIGRYGIGLYFKKKFSKRPPPGVIIEMVANKNFSESIESYCTSLSSKTSSYKIKKNELLEPINFNSKVNKGDVIAKLSTKSILLFLAILICSGVVGVLSYDAYQRQWVMKNCPTPDHPFKYYYPTFRSHPSCPN